VEFLGFEWLGIAFLGGSLGNRWRFGCHRCRIENFPTSPPWFFADRADAFQGASIMGYWTDRQKEIGHDYNNHPWAEYLTEAVQEFRPDLKKELEEEGEWRAYLSVKVAGALEEAETLKAGGYPSSDANLEALNELLPKNPQEQDDYELDEEEALGAFGMFVKYLENQSSKQSTEGRADERESKD
jgi:hypothetical protein